jgi:hypothetical protein
MDNKKSNSISFPLYIGTGELGSDIMCYLCSEENQNKKKAAIIKKMLRSFILQQQPYDMDIYDLEDVEIPSNTRYVISFKKNDIIYKWYKKYIAKDSNRNGALRNIIHYQLFNDDLADMSIDILKYRDLLEVDIPKLTENKKKDKPKKRRTQKKVKEIKKKDINPNKEILESADNMEKQVAFDISSFITAAGN